MYKSKVDCSDCCKYLGRISVVKNTDFSHFWFCALCLAI